METKQNQSSISSIAIAKVVCECGKAFNSEVQLKLHRKIKHDIVTKADTINDSDSSNSSREKDKEKLFKKKLYLPKNRSEYQSSLIVPKQNKNINAK